MQRQMQQQMQWQKTAVNTGQIQGLSMLEPAIPQEEADRLAELVSLRLLDTLPEERFDRITRIAKRLFQVSIALVSLVDAERQFFKSRQGCEPTETPRNISFCGHAILQPDIFVVQNALADPRFVDNPLVTGAPYIRFYAGFPLQGPGGQRVGTLCLIDTEPRTLDAEQLETLRELGHWVEMEMNSARVDEKARQLEREGQILEQLKALNQQLADTTHLQQAILNGTEYGIISADLAGRIVLFNAGAEHMLGYSADEMIGQSPACFHVEAEIVARAEQLSAELGQLIEPGFATFVAKAKLGQPDEGEWTYVRKDGSKFPVRLSVTALFDQKQEVSGFVGIAYDLTALRRIEHMKHEFISTVSHELRTPLTSIRGSLGLLASGVVGVMPERAQVMIDIAKSNCERLVRLINDILDIEKIESGNMRFDMVRQALLPLVEQSISMTQAYSAQYQVQLRTAFQCDGNILALVDADRLLQVLVNLISNACKFSPAGGEVLLGVDLCPDWVRVSVKDQGPGISGEFRHRIFQKFAQNDSSDTRSKGGTGLGLNISKAIIERMNGRIGFVSEEGRGSEFFIELPYSVALAVPAGEADILICEDDPDIAHLLSLILQTGGYGSVVANDAATARRLLCERRFSAMTLDLALPGEDGLSLLRWMRAQPALQDFPVVVVSAKAEAGREEMQGGAVAVLDWMSKPIDEQRLLQVLRNSGAGEAGRVPRILHVDDDADVLKVVGAVLAADFDVVPAASLQQAREKLAQERFHLILLDLSLPDGNGAELLGSLPAPNQATPVVIFSAHEVEYGMLEKVRAALVKSKTSNEQLSQTLQKLMGHLCRNNMTGE
jgi:PAS domain S-box-containing protein